MRLADETRSGTCIPARDGSRPSLRIAPCQATRGRCLCLACRAIAAEERAAQLSVALEREELESSRLRGEAATLEEQLDQARRDVEVCGVS